VPDLEFSASQSTPVHRSRVNFILAEISSDLIIELLGFATDTIVRSLLRTARVQELYPAALHKHKLFLNLPPISTPFPASSSLTSLGISHHLSYAIPPSTPRLSLSYSTRIPPIPSNHVLRHCPSRRYVLESSLQ
jgi:hypothetical protein